MHDTDFSDCSEDSDSPIGTQLPVDYSDVELLHHHRRGYEAHSPCMRSAINRGPTANADLGVAAAEDSGTAHGGWLAGAHVGVFDEAIGCGSGSARRSGPGLRGRSGARCRHQPVRLYTNPDNLGARRTTRHQWHEESSLRDEAHGLPHDGNSRARDTGLETQRVSLQ